MYIPQSSLPAPRPPPGQRDYHEARAYGAPLGTHWYPPPPPIQGDAPNINLRPKHQALRAKLNIAKLDINGYAAPTLNMTGIHIIKMNGFVDVKL